MTNTARALNSFFASFGMPAYEENSVPDNAKLPYITYTPASYSWDDDGSISAIVWTKGTTYAETFATVDSIAEAIGNGKTIVSEDGYIRLSKGTPWAQPYDTGMDNAKSVYLNIDIMTITN